MIVIGFACLLPGSLVLLWISEVGEGAISILYGFLKILLLLIGESFKSHALGVGLRIVLREKLLSVGNFILDLLFGFLNRGFVDGHLLGWLSILVLSLSGSSLLSRQFILLL